MKNIKSSRKKLILCHKGGIAMDDKDNGVFGVKRDHWKRL